ncbi:MAG: hypothetical protein DRO09_02390 [Thermoprotei archaeon]|nr:MAG: hypothetical protein DRO09_02390 [Thermoprotei archaeon]
MIRVIAVGDFHVPWRAQNVPGRVLSFLAEFAPDLILCTGDLGCREVLDLLWKLAPVVCVRGEVDWLDLPSLEHVEVLGVRFLLVHSVRDACLPRKDVDVILFGHTHIPYVRTTVVENKPVLLLNPGSATGAVPGSAPSLAVLSAGRGVVKIELYEFLSESSARVLRRCYLKETSW